MDKDNEVYLSDTSGLGPWTSVSSFPPINSSGMFPSSTTKMRDEFEQRIRELTTETEVSANKQLNELYAKLNSLKHGVPINPDSALREGVAETINDEIKELVADLIETMDNDRTEEKLSGDGIKIAVYDRQVQKIKSLIDIYMNGMKNFKL